MSLYISHSRENSGAALKLSDELVKRGVRVWLDLRELDGGADWRERVTAAIKDADGFVFLVGRNDFTDIDRQQRFEWTLVVDQEIFLDPTKPLIPFQLGDGELPGFLGARKLIQLVPGDQRNIDYRKVAGEVLEFSITLPIRWTRKNSSAVGRRARNRRKGSRRRCGQCRLVRQPRPQYAR